MGLSHSLSSAIVHYYLHDYYYSRYYLHYYYYCHHYFSCCLNCYFTTILYCYFTIILLLVLLLEVLSEPDSDAHTHTHTRTHTHTHTNKDVINPQLVTRHCVCTLQLPMCAHVAIATANAYVGEVSCRCIPIYLV